MYKLEKPVQYAKKIEKFKKIRKAFQKNRKQLFE